MKLAFLAFTAQGEALARRLAAALGGEAVRCGQPESLGEWTRKRWADAQGLVYVGAVGIAVRAVGPLLRGKSDDPAVVAVDECARYAVPLAGGHLGGANRLARRIAAVCGAQAVITTATDLHGAFAVDEWAVRQGAAVVEPPKIKGVSARLLAGQTVRVYSAWPVRGTPPPGVQPCGPQDCDVRLDVRRGAGDALALAPRIAVLGVGCKKGATTDNLQQTLAAVLAQTGLYEQAIAAVASIDLKKDEPGLLAFCRAHGWPLLTYPASRLRQTPGEFSASDFVRRVTGVDNVCERSAVQAAGGALFMKKYTGEGVTMALALRPYAPDWRWQDE